MARNRSKVEGTLHRKDTVEAAPVSEEVPSAPEPSERSVADEDSAGVYFLSIEAFEARAPAPRSRASVSRTREA